MATLNKVFLIGNLTRDPEVRVTPKGASVANFSVASSRKFKAGDSGEAREETVYVDFEAWGKLADIVGQYCAKGSPVLVEGRLKLEQWEDKNGGGKRSRMKVVAENVQFLSKRGEEGSVPAPGEFDGEARPVEADRGRSDEPVRGRFPSRSLNPRTPSIEDDADVPF